MRVLVLGGGQIAKATVINDTAVAAVDRAAAREGSRLLNLSTDFVFDGESKRAY
jgi:dTDP-4-dehydrorhamnose reductase